MRSKLHCENLAFNAYFNYKDKLKQVGFDVLVCVAVPEVYQMGIVLIWVDVVLMTLISHWLVTNYEVIAFNVNFISNFQTEECNKNR